MDTKYKQMTCDFIDTCAEAKSRTKNGKMQYAFSIVNGNIVIQLNDQKYSKFVFTLEHAKQLVFGMEHTIQYIRDPKLIGFARIITHMLRIKITEIEGGNSNG